MSTLKTTNIAHPSSASNNIVLDSSGRALVGVSSANANGGILQLSSGITFPATQVLSTDPNTLDDYEEGTWTPSVGGTATYTTQLGRYTKVGRVVIASFYIVINVIGTGSTTQLQGLPFNTLGSVQGNGSLNYWANLNTVATYVAPYIFTGSSIDFYGTTVATTIMTGISMFKNGTGVQGFIIYET